MTKFKVVKACTCITDTLIVLVSSSIIIYGNEPSDSSKGVKCFDCKSTKLPRRSCESDSPPERKRRGHARRFLRFWGKRFRNQTVLCVEFLKGDKLCVKQLNCIEPSLQLL